MKSSANQPYMGNTERQAAQSQNDGGNHRPHGPSNGLGATFIEIAIDFLVRCRPRALAGMHRNGAFVPRRDTRGIGRAFGGIRVRRAAAQLPSSFYLNKYRQPSAGS